MPIHGFFFTVPTIDFLYLVYLLFNNVLWYLFFKRFLHWCCQVLSYGWSMFEILNKPMWEDIFGIKMFCINNKLYSLDCNTNKNLIVVFLFKCVQFLIFNSSINLTFFGLPPNERPTYIKYFNSSWRKKSSHLRADFSNFPFISSKRISYLVFVCSVGSSCCFYEGVHPFTSSFII